MSDFLTRLVQRQLGQFPSIEPRVPELYAPVTAVMPLPIREEIPAETSDSRPIARAPTLVEDANPSRDPTPVLVQIRQPEPARADTVAPGKVSQRNEEPVAERPMENVNSEVAPLLTLKSTVELKAAPSLPPRAKPEQQVSLPAMVTTQARRSFFTREAEPRLTSPEEVTPMVATPRFEKESGGGELGVRQRALVSSQPPVQVTIGRIEVTAITAAAAPRRPANARKPAMSLDDYLTRRQRGER